MLRAALLSLFLSVSVAAQPGSGINLASLDRQVSPGVDFYDYANGGWLARNPLRPGENSRGLHEEVESKVRLECQQLLASDTGQLGALYASVLDNAAREQVGITPLRPLLGQIEACRSNQELSVLAGQLQRYEIHTMVRLATARHSDGKDGLAVLLYGRGLPDLRSYRENSPKSVAAREAYRKYLETSFTALGRPQATAEARDTLAFESQFAEILKDEKVGDTGDDYTVPSLVAAAPGFDWQAFLGGFGLPAQAVVTTSSPEQLRRAAQLWASTPLESLKSYCRARILIRYAKFMPSAFREPLFAYYAAVGGQPRLLPEAVRSVEELLPLALGAAWSQRFVSGPAKDQAMSMAENIRNSFRERLSKNPWMSPSTRQEALSKLSRMHFVIQVGADSEQIPKLDRHDLLGNSLRIRQQNRALLREQVGRPNRGLVERAAFETNAEYVPIENTMVILGGLLRPPFLDPGADPASTFGALGTIIAHEITHGFDGRGLRYDSQGALRNWWSGTDLDNFARLSSGLERQFSSYRIGTEMTRGRQVLGEAIADLGGVQIAYDALQADQSRRPRLTLDGFSPEQRFFLAYAQSYAQKLSPNLEQLAVRIDEHPLARLRVNGSLANLPDFWKAFGVKPGQPMVIDPPHRIW